MRGIERVIAGLLLVGAVAGAAVFAHGLGKDGGPARLVFAAAPPASPPATSTVRIAIPSAPTRRLARPDESQSPARIVAAAETPVARVAVTPVARPHLRPVVAHVAAPKPATPRRAAPVREPAAPVLPPTQQAHVKVTLTPTDPSRILATTPVPLTPTSPFIHDDGQSNDWSAQGSNGHGHGHGD